MTEAITEGRSIATYHQEQRAKLAERMRTIRNVPYTDAFAGLTPKAQVAIRQWSREQARGMSYRSMPRLASRRDIVRHARSLRQWASDVRDNTDWDSMWCGQQDALCDKLDAARQDARALRAYARSLR